MFQLPSFAKINLGLKVLGKRDDGFHDLETIFQTVSLHDTISFEEHNELIFECDNAAISKDDNLIVKAATKLAAKYSIKNGAKIFLEKRIPFPGGLGGGSSNAATALIGLSRLWNIDAELYEIAAELGSDVPFFLYGGTARGTGRGTEIEPLEDSELEHMLIVTPNIDVSTRDVFETLDVRSLTSGDPKSILLNYRFGADSIKMLENDLEATVFDLFPDIGSIKHELQKLGATAALMSGSGASVFAIFEKEETRQTAVKALEHRLNWRTFAVAAISRRQFREALFLA
jgi:4-diphosphocytidyl-2-C-methyl-D-erythritol kinase